jgi:hypothetical protein
MKLTLALLVLAICSATNVFANNSKISDSIAPLHRDIIGVYEVEKDDALEIVILKNRILSAGSVVFSLAENGLSIMREVKKIRIEIPRKRIRFTIAAPVIDEYGNKKSRRILAVTFMTSDLMKVNYSTNGILPGQLLNIYEKAWRLNSLADTSIIDYCREEVGKISRDFCLAEKF